MKNDSIISFVQIAENTTSQETVLSIITMDSLSCGDVTTPNMYNTIVWSEGHQEYMSIRVDPQEKFAHVFSDSFILSYDLSTNSVDQFVETTNGTFWNEMKVTIRTFYLTNEWALVAGYTSAWRIDSRSLYKAFLVQFRPFRFISSSSIDDQTISTAETLIYN